MRILHVYKDFHPVVGGIENHLMLLTRELSRVPDLSVEVLVTNTGYATTVEHFGRVQVTKAGRIATVASTPISLSLFREVSRRAYDIIHLHFPYPLGEMASLLRGRTRRIVVTYHSDVVRQRLILRFYHRFLLRVLSRADAIIASSPNYVETSRYLSLFRDKCTVIPYGVDVSLFRPASEPAGAMDALGRYEQPLIIFVGKFRYYKGLHHLVEAMQYIGKGTLVLVGTGPEETALRDQVRLLGIESRVAFVGHFDERLLPSVYQSGQLFVLPSCERSEAFGVVQLEAMACGLPVVSTDIGTGTSYVNRDGETGLIVPHSDPPALAAAINRLLGDETMRRAMGRAARERVETEFTKERMVDSTVRLYRRVL